MSPIFQSTHIQLWPIERLVPYARNARLHSDNQIDQIAASIREFGFTNPILVDNAAGIVAGHARMAAARKLSLAEVPVIVLDHLTEVQKRAYVLVDNKLAENSTWDEEMLNVELQALAADQFDVSLTGFCDAELDRLLAQVEADPLADEDAAPAAEQTAITRPGELWLLGRHRVVCGDALAASTYDRLLGGAGADMVITDPPYNVDYHSRSRRIMNDNLGDGFEEFLFQACQNLLGVCRGAVYICMSSSELATLQRAFTRAGGHWSTFLIWSKHTFTLGRSDYQRQYEPILYGWKEGGSHYWCGDRDQSDIWEIAKPAVNDLHPTMKPVELIERAIRNSSRRDDIILDPFGGSGSTVIAAEKLGRPARLIELEARYVDVIIRRWQDFTGAVAVLDGDGRSFAEITAERSETAVSGDRDSVGSRRLS
jgi:DNA modification methylase